MKQVRKQPFSKSGISLMEMLTVVAVIGILSAVSIPVFERFYETSQRTIAENVLEVLNDGVNSYLQMEGTNIQNVPASSESYDEELDVLRALQWVDESEPFAGGPYVRADYDPAGSNSADDYRAIWNGSYFELAEPGTEGAGIKIRLDGSDYGKTVTFGDGFVPLASY